MIHKLLLLFAIVFVFSSCKKDETHSVSDIFHAGYGVYISSEGNFQSANSNICYYNPLNNGFVENVYENVNDQPLGDICQSMSLINGRLYVVVNNSGKIEICNLNSMVKEGTITGFTSPRFMIKVDTIKAYVSDLMSNHISVVNTRTNIITNTIPLSGWTEQMLKVSNLVYITNINSEYLFIADPLTDQLIDSIHITKGAASLDLDVNGKLWVLCGGDWQGAYNGALHRIDLSSKTIEQTFTFGSSENPNHLCMNAAKDSLYYINGDIYKMGIAATSLPASSFVVSNNNSFYSLKVDPSNDDVYVSDAIDYIQKGRVFRYSATGNIKKELTAGIVPGDFLIF